MRKAQAGNTLVELIMVMLLLILFGLTISSLIYSGSQTQERIISEKNSQIDARIALSYLNMRIRQSDEADKLTIEKNTATGRDSIVIRERFEWGGYDTWIFWTDGFIYECLADPGEQPSVALSERIASVDLFTVEMSGSGAITNTIHYTVNGVGKTMQSGVYLRSGQ